MLGRKVRFEHLGNNIEGYVFASDSLEYSIAYLDESGRPFKSLVIDFMENWKYEIVEGKVKVVDLDLPNHLRFRREWARKSSVKPIVENIE